jgi:hypothetical protein
MPIPKRTLWETPRLFALPKCYALANDKERPRGPMLDYQSGLRLRVVVFFGLQTRYQSGADGSSTGSDASSSGSSSTRNKSSSGSWAWDGGL